MKNIRSKFLSSVFVVATLVFLSSNPVFAQDTSSRLTVIPPKFELFSNPGDRVNEIIRVRNDSNEAIAYTVQVEDFTTSGEEGQVVLAEDESNVTYSLANWLEPAQREIVLQPHEELVIPFFINVPKNAEPGGHYASVLFESVVGDLEGGAGAAVSNRIGSLVLLRVSGNVVEEANIETFSSPGYMEKGPVPMTLRLKNNGNAHIIPKGTIVITNMFGKKVDEIALNGKNVLPGAIRKMDTLWDKGRVMGVYNATLISTYGQQDKPITATTKFTVLPKWAIAVGFAIIFIVVGLIVTIIFGRKRLGKMLGVMFKG